MKKKLILQCLASAILCVAFLCLAASTSAADRFIRLRAGSIATPEPVVSRARLQSQTPEAAVSGLYLVQFNGRIEAAWRDALSARGHTLMQYVPDDALIVRLNQARLSELQSLPFVRWVGAFRPGYKIDPRLTAAFAANPRANLAVKLLSAPDAGTVRLAEVARLLPGATRRQILGMGTTFQGWVNIARLRALALSEAVLWIEPVSRMRMVDEVATKIVAGETDTPGGLAHVHQLGFDGRGVTVAVADSGLDSGDVKEMHPDVAGRVDALLAYGGLPDASDEHSHGSHVAGIVAGNGATGEKDDAGHLYGLGVAPGAHLVIQRIFDAAGDYYPPSSYDQLTQDAVRNGAYIASNSWGDDTGGQYDLSAAEFDALVRDADNELPGEQAYFLEFSAGNSGPASQTIGSPAVAKNVLATGATQNNRYEFPLYGEGQEVMADFSSRGPAEDGRIKPDVTAPGTWISSIRSVFANDNNAWGPISDNYLYMGGTSQAGPHASGAAAVAVQWYRDTHAGATPSPALLKAMLINSAEDMGTAVIPDTGGLLGDGTDTGDSIVVGDTSPVPNNDEGWGRLNLVNLIDSNRRFLFVEQGRGLTNGQTYEQRMVAGSGERLKITLVYTDVPALPLAIPALVNDLDLEVIAPDGSLYRGNAFSEGESVAGTPQGDRVNNVEAVHLAVPQAGEWTVRVRGWNVVQDVHKRASGAPEQDFAMVVSGQLPAPGEGVISWDREAYRAPGTASIRLVDSQLADRTNVAVTVASTTDTSGFAITLARVGSNGSFLGSVELAPGQTTPGNGKLAVKDGDELTVVYHDADPLGDRRSTARIDLQPPIVSDVVSLSQFGRVTVTWTSSEAATSSLYYGQTNAVTNLVSVPGLVEQHKVSLPELTAGETYYYYVVSADSAGNATTNLLDGRVFYRFIAPQPVAALLVYTPESYFAEGGLLADTPYPGIENWTGTLDALGVVYEVWDTSKVGRTPTAAELQPYRVVLWRPEELLGPAPGILSAITSYVQGGGALFAASFDILSRLQELTVTNDFMAQVLHVANFTADSGATSITGAPGDPIGAGMAFDLNFDSFPSGLFIELMGIDWFTGTDQLTPATNASPVFLQEEQRVVGVRYPKTGNDTRNGRVVFLSFPLEAVPADQPAPNNRATLLANALRFLTPELIGGSTVAFDQPAYTVPGNVVVEATDSKRAGGGSVTVTVFNGARKQTFDLAETPRRGVFRGRFTLQSVTGPGGAGQLTAQNGDTLRAEYVDTANTVAAVQATVDTVKPAITNISVDAAYNEAVVSWTTDKPADALVRFGESGGDDSFLTRSAYNAEQSAMHEVQLKGLLPDKTYYFKVVSRDEAGNMAVDDRDGQFHTLRTLAPLTTPWIDRLDRSEQGWAVYSDTSLGIPLFPGDEEDGGVTGSDWQFGAPQNTRGIVPHTGTNVWATNLKSDNVDFSMTDLITPAISLVGGSTATLRFWQYYNFTAAAGSEDDPFGDILMEAGQVALSTDNGATWKDLYATSGEASPEWEEVTVDIGKYTGQVVRIRFNYQLFAFTSSARAGWLIDDVSVDMTAVPVSEIRVLSNLAQAEFSLRGSNGLSLTGSGLVFHTNAPPSEYTVTWHAVPFYIAPAPQTNTLNDNASVEFRGAYTFPDANGNGISDLWEQQYFGGASSGHLPGTDTDGDGASDLQEFLAGTNPKDANSFLRLDGPLSQPNHTVRFEWPGTAGRDYQLEVSNDLIQWQAVGGPLRGAGAKLGATLSALDTRLNYYFRLRVTP